MTQWETHAFAALARCSPPPTLCAATLRDGSIDVAEYKTFIKFLVATVTRRRCEAAVAAAKCSSPGSNPAGYCREKLGKKIAAIPQASVRAECSKLLDALDAAWVRLVQPPRLPA